MEQYIELHDPGLYKRLKSIPGIGTKTAVFLIVITDGFRHFESSKQVSSYLGCIKGTKMPLIRNVVCKLRKDEQ